MLSVSPLDKDLARQDKSFENTVAQMRDIRTPEGRDSLELMHIIPRTCLEALLSGTVGFDAANNVTDDYDSDGPGIFVIGIEIPNRNGAFVTATELQVLVDDLAQYLDEADAVLSHGEQEVVDNRPSFANQSARRSKLSEIDQKYGVYPHRPGSLPRFVESRSSLDSMREFFGGHTCQVGLLVNTGHHRLSVVCSDAHLRWMQPERQIADHGIQASPAANGVQECKQPLRTDHESAPQAGPAPHPQDHHHHTRVGREAAANSRAPGDRAGVLLRTPGRVQHGGSGGNTIQLHVTTLDERIYILVTKTFWKANFDLSEKELDAAIELDAEIMSHKAINELQALVDSTEALMKTEEETNDRITKLMSELDAAAQSILDQTEKAR